MAAQVDGENLHDGVSITLGAFSRRGGILVVDATGARDFIMNGLRVPRPLGAVVLALHDAAGAHFRWLPGRMRYVIPELLRALDAHALCQALPFIEELAVNQNTVPWLCRWPLTGTPSGDKRAVGAGRWIILAQGG